METECRVAVYQSGHLYATKNAGPHDWRLHEREEKKEIETHHQEGAPGYGNVLIKPTGVFTETWYCTRCRLVETREVGP